VKKTEVTLYIFLLTGLKLLFCRYSGQMDIVLGTGYASRDKAELKNVIGFFINTLPLRSQFTEHFNFLEALAVCKQTVLEAMSNSDLPFDLIIEKLKIEREPDRSPLFQILFLMQDAADNAKLELNNISASELTYDLNISIFDITF